MNFVNRFFTPVTPIDPMAVAVENGFVSDSRVEVPQSQWAPLTARWNQIVADEPRPSKWSPEERRFADMAFRRYAECAHLHGLLKKEYLENHAAGAISPELRALDNEQFKAVEAVEGLFHVETHQALLKELRHEVEAHPDAFPTLVKNRSFTLDRAMMSYLGDVIRMTLTAYDLISKQGSHIRPERTSVDVFKPDESFRGHAERYQAQLKRWQER